MTRRRVIRPGLSEKKSGSRPTSATSPDWKESPSKRPTLRDERWIGEDANAAVPWADEIVGHVGDAPRRDAHKIAASSLTLTSSSQRGDVRSAVIGRLLECPVQLLFGCERDAEDALV